MEVKAKPLSILITGCSAGGIGSALALAFASRGHHVFATLRNTNKVSPELSAFPNVTVLQLDVTVMSSITAAVEAVTKTTGGLDILVNNAGVSFVMPLIDVDIEQGKRLFETNFWGVLAVTTAFMDLLVQAKGTVVNISSVAAELNVPWFGIYTASKGALTTLSETLRLEVAPLGVQVQTIMVGNVKTNALVDKAAFVLPPTSRYLEIRDAIARWVAGGDRPKGMSPDVFAEKLVKDILSRKRGLIYRGGESSTAAFISRYLPTWIMNYLVCRKTGLEELAASFKAPKRD